MAFLNITVRISLPLAYPCSSVTFKFLSLVTVLANEILPKVAFNVALPLFTNAPVTFKLSRAVAENVEVSSMVTAFLKLIF